MRELELHELQTLEMYANGRSADEIAAALDVSKSMARGSQEARRSKPSARRRDSREVATCRGDRGTALNTTRRRPVPATLQLCSARAKYGAGAAPPTAPRDATWSDGSPVCFRQARRARSSRGDKIPERSTVQRALRYTGMKAFARDPVTRRRPKLCCAT